MQSSHTLRRATFGTAALLAAAVIGGCAPQVPAETTPAATPGAMTTTSPNASRGTATGPDENITVAAGPNDPAGTRATRPDVKGGAASRGGNSCAVRFDNRSSLNIGTFVDGKYTGAMGGWGDVYTYAVPGPTRLYATATFTDGSVDTWGPVVVNCPSGGSYTWRLTHTRF